MILSPPFLPARPAAASSPPDPDSPADPDDDEHDAAYVALAMTGGSPGEGAYPVSFEMNWHGGVHLKAPRDSSGKALKVRAIADGTVVFRRAPTPRSGDSAHPLNYGAGWTDDGCVVIRHNTEIGANAAGTPINVTFFSVYMHLSAIPAAVAPNQVVYRKDEVGTAGSIYGTIDQVHVEIVCDTENVRHLTGRTSTYSSVNADGRTDAVFGTLWFFLPVDTPFFAADPHGTAGPLPAPVFTNPEGYWVGMTFRTGTAVMQTHHLDGQPLGAPVLEANYEYELYQTAKTRFPHSPSAGFELLRFGRVLGPDVLTPPGAPHWRRVAYDGGIGWVNLNAPNVRKFSDADFPSWDRWWMLIDASSTADSRCTDVAILDLLDPGGDLKVSPSEWQHALGDASVQARLSHKICNFPTEWDATTIDRRYGWLKEGQVVDGKLQNPRMDAKQYARFKAHVRALCFWQENTIGLGPTHWHFHPRRFITHFRKCGWLAPSELAQLLPRRWGPGGSLSWADALRRVQQVALHFNLMLRKHNVLSSSRQIHLVPQLFAETRLATMRENLRGAGKSYDAFYGRGAMQLTWPASYEDYGHFRGLPNVGASYAYQDPRITHTSTHLWSHGGPTKPWYPRYDPELVADDPFAQCDSAGFYWISKALGGHTHSLNRVADHGTTRQVIGDISVLINGGFNGFVERATFAAFAKRYRGDSTESTPHATVTFNYHNTYVAPHANSSHTFSVDYTPQRP